MDSQFNPFKKTFGGYQMKEVSERLEYLIKELPQKVKLLSEGDMATKLPCKWSKKEILGHLCDSATNNHHRFIKVQFADQPFAIAPYAQNNWVAIQDYQNLPVDDIVGFWTILNIRIANVVSKIPEAKLSYLCEIDENQCITLSELIHDYLRHMDHHLVQIFGTTDI
jgi:hypothetical protein